MNLTDKQSMDSGRHPGNDELEKYFISGGWSEAEAASLEEHLLACGTCRKRLEEIERCVTALRSALQRHQG